MSVFGPKSKIWVEMGRSVFFGWSPESGKRLFTQGRPTGHDEPPPMRENLPRLWANDAQTDHINPLRVLWGLFEGGFGCLKRCFSLS